MAKQQLGTDYPEATERLDRGVLGFFSAAERILLVIISLLTMLAVVLGSRHFLTRAAFDSPICCCSLSISRSSAWPTPTTPPIACP